MQLNRHHIVPGMGKHRQVFESSTSIRYRKCNLFKGLFLNESHAHFGFFFKLNKNKIPKNVPRTALKAGLRG